MRNIIYAMRSAIVLLALLGCAPHRDADRDGDPPRDPDAGSSSDPNCHWDCFGAIECRGGVASAWISAPVPCSAWTGSCPRVSATCAAGCAIEFRNDENVEYDWQEPARLQKLCAETLLVEVGDLCQDSCLPIRATTDDQGMATLRYLACDRAAHACVVADPPVYTGYLGGCPGAAAHFDRDLRAGVVSGWPEQTFDLRWCLVARNDAGAMRHGLTLSCLGDWDCPAGSTCDTFRNSSPISPDPSVAVCRPGPRGSNLFDRLP